MNILSRFKLHTKLTLLMALSMVAMFAIGAVGATTLHQRMLDDRMDKFRAIVASTVSIAAVLEARAGAHEITRDEAVELFHRDIRAIRFDNGIGYLSVIDASTGTMLMHGVNPKLEGKPTPIDTATKQPISRLVMEAVRSSDEGIASYMFPKPGQTEALRKIVAVAKFSPWNIAVYGGAYIDDLQAAFNASLLRTGAVGGAILLVTLLAAWLVRYHRLARQAQDRHGPAGEGRPHDGDSRHASPRRSRPDGRRRAGVQGWHDRDRAAAGRTGRHQTSGRSGAESGAASDGRRLREQNRRSGRNVVRALH
jgi:hypothetical protein